jgi:RecA/RadA recombinase
MAEQEADITNFSTSSSHRLPTVSAAQALELAAQKGKRTSTGLSSLDDILRTDNIVSASGGIPRGQVTEIYGPPGVGKTVMALQIAVNAIRSYDARSHVVWVNTGSSVPPGRVNDFIHGYTLPKGEEPTSSPPQPRSHAEVLEKFNCIDAFTLTRLITIFLHPTDTFPPAQAGLIVVDDLSNLIHGSFPKSKGRSTDPKATGIREKQAQKAAGRKWIILADIATAMSRMAAVRDIAILVINQTATSLSRGEKARLKPALTSLQWTSAVQNRILLYRDFVSAENAQDLPAPFVHQMRFAEVAKLNGKERDYGNSPTSFVITNGGVKEIHFKDKPSTEPLPQQPPPLLNGPTKRKADEIADSEEEGDEVASDDELGLPVEDDSDSDVEILGDNKTRPPVVTASQQLVLDNVTLENSNGLSRQPGPALPVRASPRKPTPSQLLRGSEDYLTQADEEEEDEPLTSSDSGQDPSPLQ